MRSLVRHLVTGFFGITLSSSAFGVDVRDDEYQEIGCVDVLEDNAKVTDAIA